MSCEYQPCEKQKGSEKLVGLKRISVPEFQGLMGQLLTTDMFNEKGVMATVEELSDIACKVGELNAHIEAMSHEREMLLEDHAKLMDIIYNRDIG